MQEESSPSFSDRLREAMAAAGLTASKISKNTGVSKGYLSGLLSGSKSAPSEEVSKKFSEVLRVSPSWLLHGIGPMVAAPQQTASEPNWQEMFYQLIDSADLDWLLDRLDDLTTKAVEGDPGAGAAVKAIIPRLRARVRGARTKDELAR